MNIGATRISQRGDVLHLVNDGLRDADMLELIEANLEPELALEMGLAMSQPHAFTVTVDEVPAAMFGVCPDPRYPDADAGVVWLLGTDRILNIRRQFLRESLDWIDEIASQYSVLGNSVHCANLVHIRWLKWLGFTFIKANGPMVEFARISSHV